MRFSHFVGIDWSGAVGCRHPSVQVAICDMGVDAPRLVLPPSGVWSRTGVLDWLGGLSGDVLVGMDAGFGFAAVPPQAPAHSRDATTPNKLSLDQGRKWTTDAPLRDGMNRIRTLVEPQLAAAHAGKLSPAQYAALARRIETEVGGIVISCKLEPTADAVLHIVIGEIGAGTAAMVGKTAPPRPAQGLVQVAKALNDYGGHFDHPGFKPIHNVH